MTERPRSATWPASAPDAELARRIHDAGGAPAADAEVALAEAELCRRLMPRVRLYGLRHLRDPDAAADLTQTVLLLTLQKLKKREVARPESIASFALGVARMTARDLRRADTRWRQPAELATAGERLAVDPDPPEPVDAERLRQCLAELGERERSVIVLTFYGERTARQIGEELGLSDGNVRVVRSRAVSRLRNCMQLHAAGEER